MSLVDAIPQTIKQIGQARGRGALASGNYGRSIADIGKMVSGLPQKQRQQEMQELELSKARREEQAEIAITQAMQSALTPDGSIDTEKLGAALAGGPGAAAFPKLSQAVAQMQEAKLKLQQSKINLQEAETDHLGALGHAAELKEPGDQAGFLVAGIAAGIKSGVITPDRGRALMADLLDDGGQPDPAKVSSALKDLQNLSKEQRTLAATDAAKKASAESAQALADERAAKTLQQRLSNVSKQLGGTRDKAAYERVFRGLPADLQGYFDAPDAWSKDSSQRALDLMLTPDQAADNARNTRQDAETRRHNVEMETSARIRANRTGKTGDDGEGEDEVSAGQKRAYDLFVENYLKRHPQERREEVSDGLGGTTVRIVPVETDTDEDIEVTDPVSGKKTTAKKKVRALPPPAIDKWLAMTATERQGVLNDPTARITDAEMLRRRGGGTPTVAAKPTGIKVSKEQLEKLAKVKGTSVEVQRKRAEAAGYTVE